MVALPENELLVPDVWEMLDERQPVLPGGITHSVKVSVKVNSSVWLNPGQRPGQVRFTQVGGGYESLCGEGGPAHLRGRLEGQRGLCRG